MARYPAGLTVSPDGLSSRYKGRRHRAVDTGLPSTSNQHQLTELSIPIIYSKCLLQDPNGRKLSCPLRRAVLPTRLGIKIPRFPSFKPFTQPHSLSTGMVQQQPGHWDLRHPFVLSRALVTPIVLSRPCQPIHPQIPAQTQASFPWYPQWSREDQSYMHIT